MALYLWVDALWIVQDDEADWAREAARMKDVYSGSALTIVASRAEGNSEGVFGIQSYHASMPIPYKSTHVNVSDNYARDHGHDVLAQDRADIEPINKRAWTFQEAVLSTRAVYFTSQELRWECSSWRRRQCGRLDKQFPPKFDAEQSQYEGYRMWRLDDFFPTEPVGAAYDQWVYTYLTYTNRSLSQDRDRLVALSGLAQRFAKIMETRLGRKEHYLAGLWAGSLPRDLLWFVELRKFSVAKGRRHERPTAWRAPSWSWASMEAPVDRGFHGDLQSSATILEALTEPLGPDPFAQVKSGFLKIQAPLLHGVVFNHDPTKSWTSRFSSVRYNGYELRITYLHVDDDNGAETDRWLTSGSQTFSILVVGYTKAGDLHEVLILVPAQNGSATFERVGIARLGPHLRVPREHAEVIENAPVQDVILA